METQSSSRDKIRVLYVVESFSTGVYAVVRDVARSLDPHRFEVSILHSLRDDSPKSYKDDFNYPHLTLTYLPMGSLTNYFSAIQEIKKVIKDFRPHVIHLHSSKAGFLGRIAAHKDSARLFYTPHGISYIRTDVGALKRTIFFVLEKGIQRYTPSTIIAISEAEKAAVSRLNAQVVTIPNFIDISTIPTRHHSKKCIVGITGRVTEAKNPPLFNRIALSMPHIQFLWVGDGPLRNELSAPNITITGQVSRSEALQYVSTMSIYIQTSSWEGLPISLLEAMACKLPVIVTDISAHLSIITHSVNGLICTQNSEHEFKDAINTLQADIKLQKSLGESAYEYVLKHHSIDQAIARYSAEYAGTTD